MFQELRFKAVFLIYDLGMYALRERRQHVTQEDFEFAVAKVGLYFEHHLTIR